MYAMCGLLIATHKWLISVWTKLFYTLVLLHGSMPYSQVKHPLKQP